MASETAPEEGDDALTAFLYQVMRDDLPVGTVEKNISEMERSEAHHFDLSNRHLANYARACAERLTRITSR